MGCSLLLLTVPSFALAALLISTARVNVSHTELGHAIKHSSEPHWLEQFIVHPLSGFQEAVLTLIHPHLHVSKRSSAGSKRPGRSLAGPLSKSSPSTCPTSSSRGPALRRSRRRCASPCAPCSWTAWTWCSCTGANPPFGGLAGACTLCNCSASIKIGTAGLAEGNVVMRICTARGPLARGPLAYVQLQVPGYDACVPHHACASTPPQVGLRFTRHGGHCQEPGGPAG